MPLKRHRITSEVQQKLIIGLIVSDKFCDEVLPMLEPYHIKDENSALLVRWIRDFHAEHNAAPGSHIRTIFLAEREQLDPSQATVIDKMLSFLGEKYEESVALNWDFYADKIRDYCRKTSLKKLSEEIKALTDADRLDAAEEALVKHRKIEKRTSRWFNPLNDKNTYIEATKKEQSYLFEFGGQLGAAGFQFQRDWLVGFLAPPKAGKSWWLMETAVQAYLKRLNVVFVSLEMNKNQVSERLYKRFTCLTDRAGEFVFPVFDCIKNKNNTCHKQERTNFYSLSKNNAEEKQDKREKDVTDYDKNAKYKPCTYCKKNDLLDQYEVGVWFETRTKNKTLGVLGFDPIKAFTTVYGDRIRVLCYPRFGLSMKGLESELSQLEKTDDFVPDVIIVDYADILSDEGLREQGRDVYDAKWKRLGGMAAERHCCVFTASQANRVAIKLDRIGTEHTAEDIRKLAHVDMLISINQTVNDTKNEKELHKQRLEILAHRHRYDTNKEIHVLQQLELGQVNLDSFCFHVNNSYNQQEENPNE